MEQLTISQHVKLKVLILGVFLDCIDNSLESCGIAHLSEQEWDQKHVEVTTHLLVKCINIYKDLDTEIPTICWNNWCFSSPHTSKIQWRIHISFIFRLNILSFIRIVILKLHPIVQESEYVIDTIISIWKFIKKCQSYQELCVVEIFRRVGEPFLWFEVFRVLIQDLGVLCLCFLIDRALTLLLYFFHHFYLLCFIWDHNSFRNFFLRLLIHILFSIQDGEILLISLLVH